MCYTQKYNPTTNNNNHYIERHNYFECEDHHPLTIRGLPRYFKHCELKEIPANNEKGYKLLCVGHAIKDEIQWEIEFENKYGHHQPASEQLKDLSIDKDQGDQP